MAKFQNNKIGMYLCIFSLVMISLSFYFLPISTDDNTPAGFHPLFPILIIGLSLIALILTTFHKKVEVRIGTISYFLPILTTGPIYLNGFEPHALKPDVISANSQYFQWEIGMHFIIIGLIMQYVGSLLVAPKYSDNNKLLNKTGGRGNKIINYNKIIKEFLKKLANAIYVLTIFLVFIFIILIPLKAFNVL